MTDQNKFSNVKVYDDTTPRKQESGAIPALTQMLANNMKALKSVLPKHITPERIARVGLNTVRRNATLCKCNPQTLLAAIMECATLGLEVDSRGQAYLVPYWNGKTRSYDVNLIIGYKGMLDLAYRSGKIASVMAESVHENDKFVISFGLDPRLEHTPALRDRGEIVAAYAIAIMKDGSKQFSVMLKDDLDRVKNASASAANGPWKTWESEMCKKSVLKRLCKLLPLSPEIQRASALDDLADAGIAQSLGDEIINIDFPDVQTGQKEKSGEKNIEIEIAQEDASQVKTQKAKILCPKSNQEVEEGVCKICVEYNGCPEWEAI